MAVSVSDFCFDILLLGGACPSKRWGVFFFFSKTNNFLLKYGWFTMLYLFQGLPRWLSGNESVCQCRRCKRCRFDPWVRKIPWRREWQPTLVFLPGKFHGQRSLVGCSLWGGKESDTTERAWISFRCLAKWFSYTDIHKCISILFQMAYYKIWNVVPCAAQ